MAGRQDVKAFENLRVILKTTLILVSRAMLSAKQDPRFSIPDSMWYLEAARKNKDTLTKYDNNFYSAIEKCCPYSLIQGQTQCRACKRREKSRGKLYDKIKTVSSEMQKYKGDILDTLFPDITPESIQILQVFADAAKSITEINKKSDAKRAPL